MDIFSKGGRYEATGNVVSSFFSSDRYYREAVLLELLYYKNLHGRLSVNLDGTVKVLHGDISDPIRDNNVIKACAKVNGMDTDTFMNTIRLLEKKYNHDIVAVQYFVMDLLSDESGVTKPQMVHWGLTSQDIVNTVYTRIVQSFIKEAMSPKFDTMCGAFKDFMDLSDEISVMGKTHGQDALPISNKHIFNVYQTRVLASFDHIAKYIPIVKFGNGAVGNSFYQKVLGVSLHSIHNDTIEDYFETDNVLLEYNTFQNNHYPYITNVLYDLHRFLHVLKDVSADMWLYASHGYIQKPFSATEHGSSTMPQKSNPIQFENCEGNLELAIGLCESFMRKLNISRMQRDLSDVTMMRNLGTLFCYTMQAMDSLTKGFKAYKWNDDIPIYKTGAHYTEAIQLYEKLKPDGMTYEEVKALTPDQTLDYVLSHKIFRDFLFPNSKP